MDENTTKECRDDFLDLTKNKKDVINKVINEEKIQKIVNGVKEKTDTVKLSHWNFQLKDETMFLEYFAPKYYAKKDEVKQKEKDIDEITNKLYAPKYAAHFLKSYVSKLSVWTLLLKPLIQPKIMYFESEPITNYVNHYAEITMRNNDSWSMADACRLITADDEFEVQKFKISQEPEKAEIIIEENLVYVETAVNQLLTENGDDLRNLLISKKKKIVEYSLKQGKI